MWSQQNGKRKTAIEMRAHICRPSREERKERASQCHSKQTSISSGESKPPFCMQIKQSVNNKETPFPALCFVTTLCVRSRSQTAFVCLFWQFVWIITNTNIPNRHEYTIETEPNNTWRWAHSSQLKMKPKLEWNTEKWCDESDYRDELET